MADLGKEQWRTQIQNLNNNQNLISYNSGGILLSLFLFLLHSFFTLSLKGRGNYPLLSSTLGGIFFSLWPPQSSKTQPLLLSNRVRPTDEELMFMEMMVSHALKKTREEAATPWWWPGPQATEAGGKCG